MEIEVIADKGSIEIIRPQNLQELPSQTLEIPAFQN
jgi:hypothetical protein